MNIFIPISVVLILIIYVLILSVAVTKKKCRRQQRKINHLREDITLVYQAGRRKDEALEELIRRIEIITKTVKPKGTQLDRINREYSYHEELRSKIKPK